MAQNKVLLLFGILLIAGFLFVQNSNRYVQPKNESEFVEAYRAKYPIPSPQPVPQGLEDELFVVFLNSWAKDRGYNATTTNRELFTIDRFYGDVAVGRVNGEAGWVMNKINGEWTLIDLGQENPQCKNLESYLSYLKDWQGLCYDETGKLIDIKHSNESYNNY